MSYSKAALRLRSGRVLEIRTRAQAAGPQSKKARGCRPEGRRYRGSAMRGIARWVPFATALR
ncbi:MAG: hypothetical protein WBL99_05930, partial [Candidatus Acidiferrales bacterium]